MKEIEFNFKAPIDFTDENPVDATGLGFSEMINGVEWIVNPTTEEFYNWLKTLDQKVLMFLLVWGANDWNDQFERFIGQELRRKQKALDKAKKIQEGEHNGEIESQRRPKV